MNLKGIASCLAMTNDYCLFVIVVKKSSILICRTSVRRNNATLKYKSWAHKKITMHRIAFKMKIFSGCEEEYKRRHEQLWPDLQQLLKDAGIHDYSIFFDETTNSLFGVMKAEDKAKLAALPSHPVMQKWWKYMADIMETNADHSPVQTQLKEVFYLP